MKISCREMFVAIGNSLINLIVIAPLAVFYWRGTWLIMDLYNLSQEPELSAWVSLAIGNIILIVLSFIQEVIDTTSNKLENRLLYFIVSRSYMFLIGFGCVNQWRGVWHLLDLYTGITWQSATGSVLSGACVLCCARCFRSAVGSPLHFQLDNDRANMFTITTRLSSKTSPSVMFALDICLTVIVINNLVVFYWRGIWTLLDLFLFPDNSARSAAYSYAISFILAFPVLLGQHVVQRVSQYLHQKMLLLQIALEDVFLVLAGIVSISHWRGTWHSLDVMFSPDDETVSAWGCHLTGYVSLIMLCSFKSSLSCGCMTDETIHEMEHSIFDLGFYPKCMVRETAIHTITPVLGRKQPSKCVTDPGVRNVSPNDCFTKI